MNNLFLLGDSFQLVHSKNTTDIDNNAYSLRNNSPDKCWPSLVAKTLGLNFSVEYEYSVPGCGNDFSSHILQRLIYGIEPTVDQTITGIRSYDQPTIATAKYNKGDLIIIGMTDISRVWHILDRPTLSNLNNMIWNKDSKVPVGFNDTGDGDQITAGREWQIYCNHELLQAQRAYAFINEINYFRTQGHNIVVIPGFPNTNEYFTTTQYNTFETTGCLFDIDIKEHIGKTFEEKDNTRRRILQTNANNGIDCRVGHMTLDNHKILAKKISQSILDPSIPLHISSNIKENFLDENNASEYQTMDKVFLYSIKKPKSFNLFGLK